MMRSNLVRSLVFLCVAAMPAVADAAGSEAADAVQRKDTPALRALVTKKVNVNTPQADGTTALHWAAHYNDVETVRLLLRAGANPGVTNRFGASPLSEAALSGNAELIKAPCSTTSRWGCRSPIPAPSMATCANGRGRWSSG